MLLAIAATSTWKCESCSVMASDDASVKMLRIASGTRASSQILTSRSRVRLNSSSGRQSGRETQIRARTASACCSDPLARSASVRAVRTSGLSSPNHSFTPR